MVLSRRQHRFKSGWGRHSYNTAIRFAGGLFVAGLIGHCHKHTTFRGSFFLHRWLCFFVSVNISSLEQPVKILAKRVNITTG
jgi:hypothetical protein